MSLGPILEVACCKVCRVIDKLVQWRHCWPSGHLEESAFGSVGESGGCCWRASVVHALGQFVRRPSTGMETHAFVDSVSAGRRSGCGAEGLESPWVDRHKSLLRIRCRHRDRPNEIASRSAPNSCQRPVLEWERSQTYSQHIQTSSRPSI